MGNRHKREATHVAESINSSTPGRVSESRTTAAEVDGSTAAAFVSTAARRCRRCAGTRDHCDRCGMCDTAWPTLRRVAVGERERLWCQECRQLWLECFAVTSSAAGVSPALGVTPSSPPPATLSRNGLDPDAGAAAAALDELAARLQLAGEDARSELLVEVELLSARARWASYETGAGQRRRLRAARLAELMARARLTLMGWAPLTALVVVVLLVACGDNLEAGGGADDAGPDAAVVVCEPGQGIPPDQRDAECKLACGERWMRCEEGTTGDACWAECFRWRVGVAYCPPGWDGP